MFTDVSYILVKHTHGLALKKTYIIVFQVVYTSIPARECTHCTDKVEVFWAISKRHEIIGILLVLIIYKLKGFLFVKSSLT